MLGRGVRIIHHLLPKLQTIGYFHSQLNTKKPHKEANNNEHREKRESQEGEKGVERILIIVFFQSTRTR